MNCEAKNIFDREVSLDRTYVGLEPPIMFDSLASSPLDHDTRLSNISAEALDKLSIK